MILSIRTPRRSLLTLDRHLPYLELAELFELLPSPRQHLDHIEPNLLICQ